MGWRFTAKFRLVKCGLGSLVGLRESGVRGAVRSEKAMGDSGPLLDVDVGIEYL